MPWRRHFGGGLSRRGRQGLSDLSPGVSCRQQFGPHHLTVEALGTLDGEAFLLKHT